MTSSNKRQTSPTLIVRIGAVGAVLALAIAGASALGTGQSFTTLQTGFQQELWASVQLPEDSDGFATILGGVAFAPNGDVWSAECVFSGTNLHKFRALTTYASNGTSTLHPEVAVVPSIGGCGLTNHPDTYMYSNSEFGVVKLDATTGAFVAGPMGAPGSALGITVDPTNNHLIYVGADCSAQAPPEQTNCTIYDLDPAAATSTIYAQVTKATGVAFVDGIYFDPTGSYLFMGSRSTVEGANALAIVARPAAGAVFPDDSQLVNYVPMTGREPDGVAFFNGTTQKFVITLDEDGDTMTRFDFPLVAGVPNYEHTPAVQTDFATGGFRGDLLQVGADGCIYATQGRHVLPTDFGTRYDNTTATTEDSIVRICADAGTGGFFTPPGVNLTPTPPSTGSIGDFVWDDQNGDGMQSALEPGLVTTVTLKNASGAVVATTSSNALGFYQFTNVAQGAYTVEAATPVGFVPTTSFVGAATIDSNGSPASVTVSLASLDDATIDFGFQALKGSIGDFVWNDVNSNGLQDAGEPGLATTVTLKTGATVVSTTVSSASGFYQFTNVAQGAYTVEATTPAGFAATTANVGANRAVDSNGSPASVTVSPSSLNDATIDFGFQALKGSIGDFVWNDLNSNGLQDAGEPGLATTVTLKSGATVVATTTSSASGFYQFTNVAQGAYTVEATTPAGFAATTANVGANRAVDSNGSPASVTVSPSSLDDATIDFGFQALKGSIGDFVWNDVNGNGLQDAGELGLVTTVTLKSGAAVVATTISSAAGFYQFTNVTQGAYTVEVATPAGFVPTAANVGANRAVDSNGSPASVTVSPSNLNDATIDFGFRAVGSIAGTTFKDYNRNGVKDVGEPIIPSVTPMGLSGAATASTTTNAAGAYLFSNLLAGSYAVTAPATWTGGLTLLTSATYTNPRNVVLTPGQIKTGVDFGYVNNTPPTCTVQTYPSEVPFRGVMTYTVPNTLKTFVVTKNLNNNFALTITPWTVGVSTTVTITGLRINPAVASQLIAVATDMFGNQVTCDPLVTTLVRDRGREEPETYTDIPYEESMVSIENDTPGLRGLDVIVNGRLFTVRGLLDNEFRQFSIRSAMHPGNDNVVVLIARGRPGGSAVVSIAEPTRRVRRR